MIRSFRFLGAAALCWMVACSGNNQPGAAATGGCAQAPWTSVAGAAVGLLVVLKDASGKVATGYTGTMRLTSTDARASLPANATFGASDAGSHTFAAALLTTGAQTLTATD